MSSTVPAFLSKLWALVENPMNDHLICWDDTGNSFHVYDQGRFAKDILPHYFKHSNIASFIRQLNMYGFRKVSHIEHGIKDESDDLEFQHMYFVRGQEHLLEKIKRKITGNSPHIKTEPLQEIQYGDINKVITEVQLMKEKQETVNTKLQSMKRENELLWREVASLRQKHSKQQQIVNKLIQFLIHLVGGRSGLGMNLNRKRPLMLSDSSQMSSPPKVKKYVKSELPLYTVQSPEGAKSTEGPVISELSDQDVFTDNKPVMTSVTSNGPQVNSTTSMTTPKVATEPVPSKLDVSTSDWKLPSDFLPSDILDLQDLKDLPTDLNTPSPSVYPPEDPGLDNNYLSSLTAVTPTTNQDRHELTDHVDSLQYDLDGLRDVLSSNQYTIDPAFLSNVMNLIEQDNVKHEEEDVNNLSASGSELVQYKPSEVLPDLFDLASLTRDDEDLLSSSIDIGDLTRQAQHVPADDLD